MAHLSEKQREESLIKRIEQGKKEKVQLDGDSIYISSDLVPIFTFLSDISKEIESFITIEERLGSIGKQYGELLGLCSVLAKKLQEHDLDFGKVTFTELPEKIVEKLSLHVPIRSQMIVLFANLEVLFAFDIAYQQATDNDNEIRKFAMDKNIVKKFVNSYCLSKDNDWFRENKKRLNVSAKQFRCLRNSLTHFFSVSEGISIAPNNAENQTGQIKESLSKQGLNINFLSPNDLYEINRGAFLLLMKKWDNDSQVAPEVFSERIAKVKSIIERKGAILMQLRNEKV